jgi:hypothetical protein
MRVRRRAPQIESVARARRGSEVRLLRRGPTTASSVSSSFKASAVSASSGVPVAMGRVDASEFDPRPALCV